MNQASSVSCGPVELHAFDLDHTLLTVNSAFHFSKFLYREGIFRFWELLYVVTLYTRHKVGISMPLRDLHHRIFRRLFKGRSVREFDCSFPSYFAKVGDSLHNQPACARLRAAQEAGHHVVIISSSAGFIVAPHARRLGVAEFYTTEYAEDAQGLLSHMVHLVEGTDKARILLEVAQRLGVSRDRTYAYSDSHIDLPFLEAAGTPVGVSPDRILRQTCLARGWEVLN